MADRPRPEVSGVTRAFRGLTVFATAGGIVAVADGVASGDILRHGVSRATFYAMALDVTTAAAIGIVVAVLVSLGRRIRRRLGPRFPIGGPLGVVMAAGFTLLNHDLFDGDWIRRQSWASAAKFVFLGGGAFVFAVGLPVLLERRRQVRRRRTRILGLGFAALIMMAITVATMAGLGRFAAYPRLETQFAIIALVGAAWLVVPLADIVFARFPSRLEVVSVIVLVATFGVTAIVLRQDESIHRVRGTIVEAPYPSTRRLMTPVEAVLDMVVPLPPLTFRHDDTADDRFRESWTLTRDEARSKLREILGDRSDWNILWVAIDTVRADHVGCYGYDRLTTPNLDAFARDAVLFRRAITPVPASIMTYSSVMSGVYGRICPIALADRGEDDVVPTGFSIPAIVGRSGRTTTMLSGSPGFLATDLSASFERGFDSVLGNENHRGFDASEVTDRGIALVERNVRSGRPFFVCLHYMDPHAPYSGHAEHPFGSRPIDEYDSEIAYTDAQVARLLHSLDEFDIADRTIVVVFSDHGEAFGEHNVRYHGTTLHQHQIRVPFLLRVPGIAARTVDRWVNLTDLGPTTLSLLDIDDPHPRLGRDLVPLLLDDAPGWVDFAYADIPVPDRSPPSLARVVFSGDLALRWRPHAGTLHAFDLGRDPGETVNRLDLDDPDQARLFARMKAWDNAIDNFWQSGEEGSAASAVDDVHDTRLPRVIVEEALQAWDDAEAAHDDNATKEVIVRELATIDRVIRSRAEWWLTMPTEEDRRLRKRLCERLSSSLSDGHAELARLRLLELFAPIETKAAVDRLVDVVAAPNTNTNTKANLDARRLAADVLRARLGRTTNLDRLRARYEVAPPDEGLVLAAALAHAGDDRGRRLLVGELETGAAQGVSRAMRALAAIDDPLPMTFAVLSGGPTWQSRAVQKVVLDIARHDETAVGSAALLAAAARGGPGVVVAARAELMRRHPDLLEGRLDAMTAAVGRTLHAYVASDPTEAKRSLASFRPEDDVVLGPILWVAVWSAFRNLEFHRAVPLAPRLLGVLAKRHPLRLCVARLQTAGRQTRFAPNPDATVLEVEVEKGSSLPSRRRPAEVMTLRVTNRGPQYLLGGPNRFLTWVRVVFIDEAGAYRAGSSERRFPFSGLLSGEATRMDFVVRCPTQPGRYRAAVITGAGAGLRKTDLVAEIGHVVVEEANESDD